MSDVKIKELPLTNTANGNDDIIIENESVTQRIHVDKLSDVFNSRIPIANSDQYGLAILDTLLINPNQAADAKVVGDLIKELSSRIGELEAGSTIKWNDF